MAVAAANPALPMARQLRLAPRWDGVGRKLTFYYDMASPWSYLGATQVTRVARECHAQLELCPILLGALFKEVGTRNTPMDGLTDAQRAMMFIDLDRWRRWWGLEAPVRFPDAFPLRTVLAQRVCIVEPAAIDPLYAAAWTRNQNIGDEAVLVAVLNDARLDGAALVKSAAQDAVKEQLRKNTDRAVAAGVCGVPSFQVDGGAVIWGQDRFNVVEDLLCGWRDPVAPQNAKL
jgi:2-hydroxychromene-2-carboxylate isomerase